MRVLGEIPPPAASLRAGTLRRRDQEAFGRLLEALQGAGAVAISGDRARKRAAAAGLAAAAAAAGVRTALLDCDLAQATLADELGLARAPGLREYLLGEVEASRILQPLALAGPGSGAARGPLVCVAAGRPAADGDACLLLGSEAFRQAMAGLRDANDLVVAEGPALPMGAAAIGPLAASADATLVCVGRAEEAQPGLPAAVTGLLVEAEPAQRS